MTLKQGLCCSGLFQTSRREGTFYFSLQNSWNYMCRLASKILVFMKLLLFVCVHTVVKEQLGAAPVSFYHVGSRVKCRASGLRMRGLPSESLTLYFKSKTLVPEQTVQREQTFIYLGWTTGKPSLPQKCVWPSWGHQSREQVFTVQVR